MPVRTPFWLARFGKSEPVSEPYNHKSSNNEYDPDENVRQQSSKTSMDMERDSSIVQNIDE